MDQINIFFLLKSIHIFAIISWMAGLFYLPRLFVYHCRVEVNSKTDALFQLMEARLLRIIMNPAMIVTFISGFGLAYIIGFNQGWLHFKILLVLFLAAFHGFLARYRKSFAVGENNKSEKFYRIINEIPTILALLIVVLVIFKPF